MTKRYAFKCAMNRFSTCMIGQFNPLVKELTLVTTKLKRGIAKITVNFIHTRRNGKVLVSINKITRHKTIDTKLSTPSQETAILCAHRRFPHKIKLNLTVTPRIQMGIKRQKNPDRTH
jgi:hypothetical protein